MNYIRLSKEISYALRHAPQQYGLELDCEGFVALDELLSAINNEHKYDKTITEEDVVHIIETSDKQRFDLQNGYIRAFYGHTIPGLIQKEASVPPPVLYHGTTHRAYELIKVQGLLPMARQYVHLSADIEYAVRVGKRRDPKPVLLEIDTASAARAGIVFYIGNDKVWLCDKVAPEYLSELKGEIS